MMTRAGELVLSPGLEEREEAAGHFEFRYGAVDLFEVLAGYLHAMLGVAIHVVPLEDVKGFAVTSLGDRRKIVLDENLTHPEQVFVTGSSAGSYGALLHGAWLHRVYPASDFAVLGDAEGRARVEELLQRFE